MLKFNSILLFSQNPQKLSEFYKKIFGKNPDMEEGGYFGFALGSGFITIGPHDKVRGKNLNPERIMINFESENVEKEFERIKDLGAKVIAEPYHPENDENYTIATLEDPDGNIFQLNSPWGEKN